MAVATAADTTGRPRLERAGRDAAVLGVCSGCARSLGLDVALVRVVALALCMVGGLGVPIYAVAAAAMPTRSDDPARPLHERLPMAIGAAILVACGLGLLGSAGLLLPTGILGPATLAGVGAALIWRRSGGEVRVGSDVAWVPGAIRTLGGVLLVSVGAALVIGQSGGVRPAAAAVISAGAVAAGIGLLVMPSLRRARAQAEAERRERVAVEERARVAGRLHDSVLQTLALIQRESDPERARALARRQDRELRAWLYGREDTTAAETLGAALRAAVSDVEQTYGVTVELVQPADVPLDPSLPPLVDATREAMTNAAKHAGVTAVNVLVQVSASEVRVFVRDRGRGFDESVVPDDRIGLRESIRGRLARAGGRAEVESAPGAGTEIELVIPRESES